MSIIMLSNSSLTVSERSRLLPKKDVEFADRTTASCVSTRFKIGVMSMLACVVLYINRVNLNVVIVSMSTQSATNGNATESPAVCRQPTVNNTLTLNSNPDESPEPEFHWSQATQGLILGSFYWGYICFQTIGSRLSEIFGGKWICGFGILISGLINLATPMLARTSLYVFIGSRVILGLAQSAVFPSFYALFTKWFPDQERSNYMPWLDTGTCIGTIVAMGVSGVLVKLGIFGGWPFVFYLSGLAAVVWFIAWALFARSDPRTSPCISREELNYIIANTEEPLPRHKQPSVPWLQILTSKEFIGVFIAKVSLGFTFSLLLTKLPTYLQNIINVPIEENGFINSYINVGYAFTLLTGGYLASLMLNKTSLSRTTVRKIFEAFYGLVMTFCLIAIPWAGCNETLVIILLLVTSIVTGLGSGGDIPIVAEMTSQFPATVFSVMNMFSSFTGFVSPWTVGLIINEDPFSMVLWSYVFYIAAALSLTGTISFIVFASAEQQPWGLSKPVNRFSNKIINQQH